MGTHVVLLGHIILIPSQLLNAESLSEKQQISLLWFDMTRFLNPWFISNKNFSINLNYDEELHGNKQGFKPVSDVWSVILLILDGHHVLEWKPLLKPPVLVIEYLTSVSMGLVVSVVVVCLVGIKDSFVVVMTSNSLVGHLLEKKSEVKICKWWQNLSILHQMSIDTMI